MKKCEKSGCYDRATAKQTYGSSPVFRCPMHVLVNGRDTVWSAKGFSIDGKAMR